mgnify:CR=1 FL=1
MNFKYYFKEVLKNIKLGFLNNKYLLVFSILLFVVPLLIGYFFADNFSFMNDIIELFGKQVTNGNIQLTTSSLFANNFKVDIILFLGSVLFAIIGILILVFNGLFIGYFATKISLIPFLALTIPHGIFEIPSLIISSFAGFIVLSFILKTIKCLVINDSKISDRFKLAYNANSDMLKQALALLILAIILVAIAAFIEANLTQYIAFNIFKITL